MHLPCEGSVKGFLLIRISMKKESKKKIEKKICNRWDSNPRLTRFCPQGECSTAALRPLPILTARSRLRDDNASDDDRKSGRPPRHRNAVGLHLQRVQHREKHLLGNSSRLWRNKIEVSGTIQMTERFYKEERKVKRKWSSSLYTFGCRDRRKRFMARR